MSRVDSSKAWAPAHWGHRVQFYEHDDFLAEQVAEFLGPALQKGQGAVVIATQMHITAIEAKLAAAGIPTAAVAFLDAATTLQSLMRDGWPDPVLFETVVGGALQAARERGDGQVVAYGEMVALLWMDGLADRALDLEQLWNGLAQHQSFTLMCAYPMRAFADAEQAGLFREVCDSHGDVRPTESYQPLSGEQALQRQVALLQQQGHVLSKEIERRKAVEARLAEEARRKDEFLAMLAHELRNPLAPIAFSVELLRRAGLDPDAVRHVDTVDRQTQLLQRLVEDLLDISRMQRGKVTLRRGPTTVEAAVRRGLDLAGPLLVERRHEVRVELGPAIQLDADAERLGQAFGNLLQNAAKYTDERGTVEVRAVAADGHVTITVRDSGIGFTPEMRARLFEMFAQAAPARGGLGLGLAVVRGIVELHGGTVDAHSAGPGMGSEFSVRLPLPAAVMTPREQASAREPRPQARRRVLVVDDNDDIRTTLQEILRMEGHEVRTAADGASALAAARDGRPDVVLCDLGLPDFDGYEVARRIRAEPALEGVLLVALSGYDQEEDRARSRAAGFVHHMAKPPAVEELLRVVQHGPPASARDDLMGR